jgi:putative hydrolases of HD superfamily
VVGEIEARGSLESVVHRDADKLECLFQALEYREAGNANMRQFVDGMLAALVTGSARSVARRALEAGSQGWLSPR